MEDKVKTGVILGVEKLTFEGKTFEEIIEIANKMNEEAMKKANKETVVEPKQVIKGAKEW